MPQTGAHILGLSGPAVTPDERAFFQDVAPWGFILFDRNIEDADQIRRLAGDLREITGRNAPILIDQAGASSACARRLHATGPRRSISCAPPGQGPRAPSISATASSPTSFTRSGST